MKETAMHDGAYWLKKFNAAKRCNLVLGGYIGGGALGDVFEVSPGKSIFPGFRKSRGPMVLKIMGTDQYREDHRVVEADLSLRRKFDSYYQQEIEIMSELKDCPYTMPLLDHHCFTENAAEHRKVYLLLMPKLQTLEEYWKEHHKDLTEGELVQMSQHLAQALAECHKLEVLHRDIKPRNIYVQAIKGGGTALYPGRFWLLSVLP